MAEGQEVSTSRAPAGFIGGGCIVAGGVLALWPEITLLIFSQVAGWAMGVAGLLGAIDEVQKGRVKSWAFARALGIGVVGVVLIVWPDRTLLVATILAGGWLLFDGGSRVLQSMYAQSTKREIAGMAFGFVEAVIGILVVARPFGNLGAAAVFTGLGLIVFGVGRIWEAWRTPQPSG
ncbi:MAG: HdeD family acid-resistance protein [Acidimicrobiales bacterium]